jgi:hypothetical protein
MSGKCMCFSMYVLQYLDNDFETSTEAHYLLSTLVGWQNCTLLVEAWGTIGLPSPNCPSGMLLGQLDDSFGTAFGESLGIAWGQLWEKAW